MSTLSHSKNRTFLNAAAYLITGALFYYLTSLIPLLGAVAGHELLIPQGGEPTANKPELITRFAH